MAISLNILLFLPFVGVTASVWTVSSTIVFGATALLSTCLLAYFVLYPSQVDKSLIVHTNKELREGTGMKVLHYNAALLSITLLVSSICLLVFLPVLVGSTTSAVGLTLTIICGVTALLSALVLASYVFSCLGLSDTQEALGLPTGSVRAIIALSLILIFAIMSVFMFQILSSPTETIAYTITTNSTILGNQTITNSTTVMNSGGSSQATIDFSKQILTTMGTLVVAIAAFYFGTRAVQVAQGLKEKAELFVDPSGTKTLYLGYDDSLVIVVKPTPEDAAVVPKIEGDEYKSLQRESENRFIYKISSAEQKEVKMSFEMPAYSDVKPEELKINIIKPDLLIEPSEEKEITKDEQLVYLAKPVPKNAKVDFAKPDNGEITVDKDNKNKFFYKPNNEGKVTLTFKLPDFPTISKKLNINVVKPNLSIDPSGAQKAKKGDRLLFEAKPTPKDAEVTWELKNDTRESITKEDNKFTYTPTISQKEVILSFKLTKYKISKEVTIQVD